MVTDLKTSGTLATLLLICFINIVESFHNINRRDPQSLGLAPSLFILGWIYLLRLKGNYYDEKNNNVLYKIIVELGGIIQLILFTALFMGSIFFIDEPVMLLLVHIVGGAISIGIGAMLARDEHIKQLTEWDTKAITARKPLAITQQLVPFNIYLKRSAFAWFVFLIGMLLLGILVGGVTVGMIEVGRLFFADAIIGQILIAVLALVVLMFGMFMTFSIFAFSEPIVDFYLYKQPEIQQMYPEGNPFEDKSPVAEIWSLVKGALLAGFCMGILLAFRIGLEYLDAIDAPLWVWGVVLICVLMFVRMMYRFATQGDVSDAEVEHFMNHMAEHAVQQHGEGSEEVQTLYAELERWQNLSPEEKKREQQEAEDIELPDFLVDEPPIGKIFRSMMICLAGILIVSSVLTIIVAYITSQVFNLHEHVHGIGAITFMGSMFGGMYLSMSIAFDNISPPDTVEKMAQALEGGDIVSTKRYLEEAKAKLYKRDYGWLMSEISLVVGNLDDAESIARESLSSIMFTNKEYRNTTTLALNLVRLGNVLIEKGQYNEARQSIQQSFQYEKNDVNAYISLAETYLYQGDGDGAMAVIEEAKPLLKKSDIENHAIMLKICESWALALQNYNHESLQLLQLTFHEHREVSIPVQAGMNYYAGHIFRQLNKHTQSELAFQRARKILPDSLYDLKATEYL